MVSRCNDELRNDLPEKAKERAERTLVELKPKRKTTYSKDESKSHFDKNRF